MKLTKRKDCTGSIRTVWNDDKSIRLGMLGTVQGFLDAGVFKSCDAPGSYWAFISMREDGGPGVVQFYRTRDDVLTAARLEEDFVRDVRA